MKYRKFNDTWEEIELDPDTLDYELTDLQCGTGYEVCISAFNEIGKGEPSSMIKVGTNGSGKKKLSMNFYTLLNNIWCCYLLFFPENPV